MTDRTDPLRDQAVAILGELRRETGARRASVVPRDAAGGNGAQIDTSHDRGEPMSFPFGKGAVIPGWEEGLASMRVGGLRTLVIPAALGYGDRGAGDKIPPGATLRFDIELVDVKDP